MSCLLATLAIDAGPARAELVVGPQLQVDYAGPDGDFLHYEPDVTWDDGGFHVAWSDNAPGCATCGEYDIRGTRVSAAGTVEVPGKVFTRAGGDWRVALASDGDEILVVWETAGDGIWGDVRPSIGGPGAMQLGARGRRPSVAAGPDGFLLVFHDDMALVAVHVDALGAVVEPTPIVLDPWVDVNGRARVVHDDESYVVVWADGGDEVGVRARRVPDSGTALGATVAIGEDAAAGPDIAWDGEQLAVVTVHQGVQLFLLDADLASRPDRTATIRGGAGGEPAVVARDGGGFLVVYSESRPASSLWGDIGIYAMRVGPDGELLDSGIPGVLGSGSVEVTNDAEWLEWHPRVARGDDGRFLVTWEGSRDRGMSVSATGIFALVLEDRPDATSPEPDAEPGAEAGTEESGAELEDAAPPRGSDCAGGGMTPLAFLAVLVRRLRVRALFAGGDDHRGIQPQDAAYSHHELDGQTAARPARRLSTGPRV